jgi:hypothetical protein
MTTKLWISFDLGINGDYERLYTWLDNHHAKECGDNFAFIEKYAYTGDLTAYLKKDLFKNVKLRKSDRVYMFATTPLKATFIFGGRKRAPWTGYGITGISGLDL